MKKALSETQFDLSDFTCPFLDGECQKDCCTHFERIKSEYDCRLYKEVWNGSVCHAGTPINLWSEYIKTKHPQPPRNWFEQIIDMIIGPKL